MREQERAKRQQNLSIILDCSPFALHGHAGVELLVEPLLVERVELRSLDAQGDIMFRDVGRAQCGLELRNCQALGIIDLDRLPPLEERLPLDRGGALQRRHHCVSIRTPAPFQVWIVPNCRGQLAFFRNHIFESSPHTDMEVGGELP